MYDPTQLPAALPRPVDDGGMTHLSGARLPDVALPSTEGGTVSLAGLPGRTVLYGYPRTGEPDKDPLTPDWDLIPGARGCTPQSCSFRDHFTDLKSLGVRHVFGISTQSTAYQQEMAMRLHLPFAVLSDEALAFTRAARLPTFTVAGHTLLKRFAVVIDEGQVTQVFYPVFPPDRSAQDVIDWLRVRQA